MTQSVVAHHVPVVLPARELSVWHGGAPYQGKSFVRDPHSPLITNYVYDCSYGTSVCRWYVKHHNVVAGTLSGLANPQGIGVNPLSGNVYVADTGAFETLEYAPNSTTVVGTFSDPNQYPVDAAVDSQGNVYVANIFSTAGAAGSVDVFNSSGTLLRNLTDPNVSEGISVGIDEHHMLTFCFNNTAGVGECDNFAHANGHGVLAESGWGFSGGSSYNINEHTVVLDQLADSALTYSSGTLCGTIHFASAGDDVMMGLSRSNGFLVEGDASNNNVGQYAYADCTNNSSESPQFTYNAGITPSDLVIGANVTPGVRP